MCGFGNFDPSGYRRTLSAVQEETGEGDTPLRWMSDHDPIQGEMKKEQAKQEKKKEVGRRVGGRATHTTSRAYGIFGGKKSQFLIFYSGELLTLLRMVHTKKLDN